MVRASFFTYLNTWRYIMSGFVRGAGTLIVALYNFVTEFFRSDKSHKCSSCGKNMVVENRIRWIRYACPVCGRETYNFL